MAHAVEMIDGVAQMAYAGDVPWHGLGTPVSNDLTPMQMQQKAGLDWEVQKVPSFIEIDGQKIKTGQESLVRLSDNKVLLLQMAKYLSGNNFMDRKTIQEMVIQLAEYSITKEELETDKSLGFYSNCFNELMGERAMFVF